MIQNAFGKKGMEGTNTQPFAGLSEEEERAIEKWKRGGLLNREDLFIAFLTLGVILMVLFIAMRVLSA